MKKILLGLAALTMVMFAGCDVTESIYDATYTIKITNDGNGTGAATAGGAAVEVAAEGVTVAITATPTGDYQFKQWVVVGDGVTLSPNTTTATATFTMPSKAVEIRAEFEAISRTITMNNDGNGTAKATISGKEVTTAVLGAEVFITATPTDPANKRFSRWVVESGPVSLLADVTQYTTSFIMPSEAVIIKAEFTMLADAVAKAATLVYNADESTGTNTVYTFTLPAAAPGATIATATVTCDGDPVASSLTGTGNVNLAFSDAVLATLPYDKDLIVTYTVAYGGETSTVLTTHTISAANITAMAPIQAIRKTASNAEVAKITGFTVGMNNRSDLVFNITGYGSLTAGTTLAFVETKAGASSGGAVATNLGAQRISSMVSFNTDKTVNAADLTYVSITFTATLNGATSDPVTLDISSLFGLGTTAGKLRTDKSKISQTQLAGHTISFKYNGIALNQYYNTNPVITLSSGVFISISHPNSIGIQGITQEQISLKADEGGNIQIALATTPTDDGYMSFLIVLNCAGTQYTLHGVHINVNRY